jgi:hypothetical protein
MNRVYYNVPESVQNLNRNPMSIAELQEDLDYKMGHSRYRNPELNYIYPVEKQHHPDYSSKFSYNQCCPIWCSGHWPGRYNATAACATQDLLPRGMAPDRFYTAKAAGPFNVVGIHPPI